MNAKNKFAAVTGANRGLGFETCRQLARQGLQVVLTSRDEAEGRAAVAKLEEEGLKAHYHPLDVIEPESIEAFSHFVREELGQLDVLVNNAGVFLDEAGTNKHASIFESQVDTVRATLETNVYGPLRLCQMFIPPMRQHGYGRVVNISSGMGQLTEMNGCCPGYRLSKAGINVLTRIFADELQGTNVLVNSVCPGWVRTDMGGPNAHRSPEQGVDTIVWLATLPDGGPSGGFFRDRTPIPW